MQQLYPLEYKIGRYITARVRQELGVELPREEVASIAMNLVNAKTGAEVTVASDRAQSFERLLNDVTDIVEYDFRTIIDRESFEFSRFATHVQYLFKRIKGNDSLSSANLPLYANSREEFPELAQCIDHICTYMKREWHTELTDEEKLYFMLHVNRICTKAESGTAGR